MDFRWIGDALSEQKAEIERLRAEVISRGGDALAAMVRTAEVEAEIARLRAELERLNGIIDAERDMQAKLVAEGTRLSADLAAARAALAKEREACNAWRKAWKRYDETRTVPAYSLMEDTADAHDARRAAEAKG